MLNVGRSVNLFYSWIINLICYCLKLSCLIADPRLTDYDTLLENIHGLKEGRPVQVPIYDFKSSSRVGYRLPFTKDPSRTHTSRYMFILVVLFS